MSSWWGSRKILLRGIQLTHVQRYPGSTAKMALSSKIFILNDAISYVAFPNAVFGAPTFRVLSQQ
jgi:hypothetical protein